MVTFLSLSLCPYYTYAQRPRESEGYLGQQREPTLVHRRLLTRLLTTLPIKEKRLLESRSKRKRLHGQASSPHSHPRHLRAILCRRHFPCGSSLANEGSELLGKALLSAGVRLAFSSPVLWTTAGPRGRTSYIICGAQCEMKV